MPTPTSTYQVTNENGNILRTIPLVLGEVRQSSCELTNASTDGSKKLTIYLDK